MSTLIPLRRVARLVYGDALASGVREDGEVPVIGSGGLSGFHNMANSSGPSIVVGRKGSYGVVHWVPRDCFVIDTAYSVQPVSDEIDKRWLYYALQAVDLKGISQDVGIPGLSREAAYAIETPVSPLSEQRRIADFLDAETDRIDRLSAVQRRMIEIIDERRTAVTSHLVYGRDRSGGKRDSTIPAIGSIPCTWGVSRIKTFMREVMDLSETGDEELLSVSHLTGVTPRSEKEVNMFLAETMVGYKRCQEGDLVINTLWAWMGALGVSRFSGIMSPAYGIYRMTSEVMDGRYLDLLVRTPEYVTEMTRFSKGVWTSRLRLYPESFLALSIPVPSREDQERIVERVMGETNEQEELKKKLESFANTLSERRQALITAAVTGQMDVTTARGLVPTGGAAA